MAPSISADSSRLSGIVKKKLRMISIQNGLTSCGITSAPEGVVQAGVAHHQSLHRLPRPRRLVRATGSAATGARGSIPRIVVLHPDCGFSPGTYWNISIDDVYDKLRSEVLAAEMLRAEVGG